MGMTGPVFVRPLQNGNTELLPERQVRLQRRRRLDRLRPRVRDVPAPRCGAIRTGPTRTSSCRSGATTAPTSALLNGRVYPDTLAPNRRSMRTSFTLPVDATDATATSSRRPGNPHLQVPAALGAGDLQRRRARAAALRQPGLQGGGDDAGGHQDAGGRQGRHADGGPRRHRHQLRGQHGLVRRRREHRRHLHRASRMAGPGRIRHLRALQPAPTSGRTTWRTAASAASGPRCASIAAGTLPPQTLPEHLGPNRTIREGDITMRTSASSRIRCGQSRGLGLALLASGCALLLQAGGRAGRAAADGHRLHHGRARTRPSPSMPRPATSSCRTATPCTCGATRRAAAPSSIRARCCASTRATPSR